MPGVFGAGLITLADRAQGLYAGTPENSVTKLQSCQVDSRHGSNPVNTRVFQKWLTSVGNTSFQTKKP